MRNVMTVDVEDYFQVSAMEERIAKHQWSSISPRVEINTLNLLELFSRFDVKATFFVLGWVAKRLNGLIGELASRGHEVACHGYSHQLVYEQSQDVFREETLQSKALLEEIVQSPVRGYRAASYSITKHSLWALDILAGAGFEYDSSIFPVHHDRYGIPDAPKFP